MKLFVEGNYFKRVISMMMTCQFCHILCHSVESGNRDGACSDTALRYAKVTTLVFCHRSVGLLIVLRYTEKIAANGRYSARWSVELQQLDIKPEGESISPHLCRCRGFVVEHSRPGSVASGIELVQQGEADDAYNRYYPSMLACAVRELIASVRHAARSRLVSIETLAFLPPIRSFPDSAPRFFAELAKSGLQDHVESPLLFPR